MIGSEIMYNRSHCQRHSYIYKTKMLDSEITHLLQLDSEITHLLQKYYKMIMNQNLISLTPRPYCLDGVGWSSIFGTTMRTSLECVAA